MSGHVVESVEHIRRPKAWKYILGGLIAFPVLLIAWVAFDVSMWHPELMNPGMETTMDKMRWLGTPLLLVAIVVGGKWTADVFAANKREHQWQQKTQALKEQEAAARNETARREYTLEVLGLGVTYEKYRQGKLWNALQQGSPHSSIREPDPKKYPWSRDEKTGVTGGRALDALENGVETSPMFWGVPTMFAGGPYANPADQPSAIDPMAGLAGSAQNTGMAWHLFVTGPWELGERPDHLLDQAFALFDAYPDLPYLVLLSTDDMIDREEGLGSGGPLLIEDGYYVPERPDASAVFVLARRERVEPLRPYVWDDPLSDYLQENLRRMYFQLVHDVPNLAKLGHPDKIDTGRQPTVAEWLQAAAVFAKHPVFDKKDGRALLDAFKRWVNHPPKDWKPTPWFPVPWNKEQMQAFDRLPSLGFIHRPVFVDFKDEHGNPVTRRDSRQKLLDQGWQQALQTLPDAVRAQGPARIVAAFDDNVDHLIAMEGILRRYAEQGGPEIDSGKTGQFINTDRRLGNTGAATFFVQMALGVMGSYNEGGASAVVNLRDPAGASIVFVSPPPDATRTRRDVFEHRVKSAIDPDDYAPPTVGAVLGQGALTP